MKIEQEILIKDLIERTDQVINSAEQLNQLNLETLNYRVNPESWSVLECIEHLNLYGSFYIPEIEKQISKSITRHSAYFKSGLLGNYFAKSMLPKERLNKMKTFKDKNPIGSNLNKSTVERFIGQQEEMLNLLDKARQVNLNKVKTGITIASWIKLKLGDTFRVVVYHNQRHIVQVNRILAIAQL